MGYDPNTVPVPVCTTCGEAAQESACRSCGDPHSHVVDHVVYKMLGTKPTYIGSEMKSRDGWIWHWQKKDAQPILEVLQTLMDNLNAVLIIGPDDKPIIRNLDMDDPNARVVYAFTDSNIKMASLGKTETRQRTEIYQKILAKYGFLPPSPLAQ